ncbi:MAG: IPTL-CTERM sorting domain-containing protein [Planctomycetota bacterium]
MSKRVWMILVILSVAIWALPADAQEPWVTGGTVTSGYCERTRNGSEETHPGVDIAVFEGEGENRRSTQAPVKAGCAGTVVKVYAFDGTHYGTDAANSDWFKNFNMVVVKCTDGTYTVFAHLSAISVTEGQAVTADTQIGTIGGYGASCANTFGNHLHLERRTDVSADGTWGAEEEDLCATGSKDHATNPIPTSENRQAGAEHTDGGGGLHMYTVFNEPDSCCGISFFRVNYHGETPYLGMAPEGWAVSVFEETPYAIEWRVLDASYEILPGQYMSGFDFQSSEPPMMVNFYVAHDDGGSGSGISRTVPTRILGAGRPAGIPAVSEWGLVIMTALLLMAALVFMRRRRALTV